MNRGAVNHRNFSNLQSKINDSGSNFCGCQAPNLFQQSLSDNKWLSIISLSPIRKKLSFVYCNDLHSHTKKKTQQHTVWCALRSSDSFPDSGLEPQIAACAKLTDCNISVGVCVSVSQVPVWPCFPPAVGCPLYTAHTHTRLRALTRRFYLNTNTWVEGLGTPLHSAVNTFLDSLPSEWRWHFNLRVK